MGFLLAAPVKKHQEIDGPYAWRKVLDSSCCKTYMVGNSSTSSSSHEKVIAQPFQDTRLYPHGPKWSACLMPEFFQKPGLEALLKEALSLGCIAFRLPKSNAVAGGVLRHSIHVIDQLLEKWYPMIFKVGYTHNCVWRWSNPIYGYGSSCDKWSQMVVLHIAAEPYSVAMLEAALIEKYQGTSHVLQ